MARKKAAKDRGNRALAVVRALLALGLAVCFFLPWISVSCAGEKTARASGYELLEGRYQLGGDGSFGIWAKHRGLEESRAEVEPNVRLEDFPLEPEPALWGWAGAVALLILLGVMGAAYESRFVSGASSLLAALILALYVWFFAFGFALERELEAEQRRRGATVPEVQPGAPQVAREPALHVSAALAAAILALGVIEGSSRRAKR